MLNTYMSRGLRAHLLRSMWPCAFLFHHPHITLFTWPEWTWCTSPHSSQSISNHKAKTSSISSAQDKGYWKLSRFSQTEVSLPPMGSNAWGSKPPHIIHPASSHFLTMTHPVSYWGSATRRKQKVVQALASDPRNSHPLAPTVLSLGVLKYFISGIWPWTLVPCFIYPCPLPSPGWWPACPHPF